MMTPLWARCEALKVPMNVLTVPGRLPQIAALIHRHPDLAVVIDHMADTPPERTDQIRDLLALARFPNVFVKISHLWSLSKQAFAYADAFGPKRLMWDTNHPKCLPHLSYAQTIALYRDHLDFTPPEDRQEIWHRTVQRIWPFGLQPACRIDHFRRFDSPSALTIMVAQSPDSGRAHRALAAVKPQSRTLLANQRREGKSMAENGQ
ncbi:amidohydrolase [Burkholderia plantarii]|uniref:Amidohydrolase n=1 Tax=Burkholderia plantarii TaxID=41899 RepID=A0A0B6S4J0_BURPL|nr:amidohydrolase [Burkholderia plantarii]